MAPTSSILEKSFIALFMFSCMFLSASSYYADAPNAQPPSSAAGRPRLCDLEHNYKDYHRVFDHIESCNVGLLRTCKVHQIYQLGDSISDVGNLIREVPVGAATPFARLPYGSNFTTGPTGRASNGYLMIDYFAMDAGLPLLPPFKKSDADFSHGVNFAVGGATALPWNVLAAMNVSTPITTSSLSVQLDWMSVYFNSICHNSRDCGGRFENAVFMLGPFGGSDYHNAVFHGKSFNEIKATIVPKVVDEIINAIRRIINLGAKKVVVPGLYEFFYLPIYREAFPLETWEVNDDLGIYHNVELHRAIKKFNEEERPDTIVVFGDYYSASETEPPPGHDPAIVRSYSASVERMDQSVCCGTGGGMYNFDLRRMCGAEGVSACKEPKKKMFWDGLQLTQEAYRIMTKYMLYNIFHDLRCPNP